MLIFSYFLVPQTSGCSQRSAGTPRLCHHSRHLQAKIRPQGKQNMAGKSTIYWREVSIQVSRWDFQWCLIAEGYINQAGIHMDDIDWNSIYYYCSQPEIEGFWSGPLNYTALWHGGDVIRNDWGLSNYSYKGKTRSLDLIDIMSIYLSACLSIYPSIHLSPVRLNKKQWWVALVMAKSMAFHELPRSTWGFPWIWPSAIAPFIPWEPQMIGSRQVES